jgi:hypothetical protein
MRFGAKSSNSGIIVAVLPALDGERLSFNALSRNDGECQISGKKKYHA